MPDFEKIINGIKAIFQLIWGNTTPPLILQIVGWGLLFVGAICAIWGVLVVLSKIKDLWILSFRPLFYKDEERRLSVQRKNFAGYIKDEVLKLDRHEDWKDFRFAELEAEVEAEGNRRIFGVIPFFKQTDSGLRHERSLSKALATSQDRLILIEGEPGSGKSVALRHVALTMAKHAEGTRNVKSVIPIYVNLKELERPAEVAIDRNLIESFVLKSLKRTNDRFVEQFLDDEFDKGMENSTWFFLFDSFDELPEVLSSTEADIVVREYGDAIEDFLHGINRCRGVVASRQFRGPDHFGWPRFRVLPLSEKRRFDLIRKMGLKRALENEFIGQLDIANQEIRLMARNPLLLTLLCEHVNDGHSFPENTHTVFETYITNRLTRDEARILRRFQLNATQLREAAEQIAFCMAADPGLGLSPTRSHLKDALVNLHLDIKYDFNSLLDALEYIKIARSDFDTDVFQSPTFTFAHRRFQEYFATCVVLREPTRISREQLLINARWRETAVVMCQTQPIDQLTMMIEEADRLLVYYSSTIPDIIDSPMDYILNTMQEQKTRAASFSWSPGIYHLLGLLQDGFSRRLEYIPDNLRTSVGKIVLSIFEKGIVIDKKWILEVAGLAPEPVLLYLLIRAFAGKSQWLKDVAYRQVARLSTTPPDIAQGIRDAIIDLDVNNRLSKERYATKAHLSRVNRSVDFLSIMKLLLWLPSIDLCLNMLLFIFILSVLTRESRIDVIFTLEILVLLLISHMAIRRQYMIPITSRLKLTYSNILRFYAYSLVVSLLLLLDPKWPHLKIYSLALLVCVIVIVFAYSFFAFTASKTGLFVKMRWWALLSFWPIIYLSVFRRSALVSFRKVMDKKTLTGVIIFVLVSGILAGIIVLWTTIIQEHFHLLYLIGIIVFFTIIVGMGVMVIGAIIAGVYHQVYDWIRWKGSHQKSFTCLELWQTLNLYHTTRFRLRLVRLVREQHLLVVTNEQEEILRNVLSAIAAGTNSSGSTSIEENEIDKILKASLTAKISNVEILDELYQLLDDLMHSDKAN